MIKDYPSSGRPLWQLLAPELIATTLIGLLYPIGAGKSRKRMPRKAAQRTVVLIHGYLANRSSLLPLRAYLRTHGLTEVLAFDYSSRAGIEQAAIGLRDFLRRNVRGGRIDLVCHSLGGLVSRVYLQELGGGRRVDRCITLGTPHRGTYNAYWVASRVGRELHPDSALMERLKATRAKASRVRFTSIIGGADNIVIPRVFSSIAENEETHSVPHTGHMSLLFSLRAFRLVAKALSC